MDASRTSISFLGLKDVFIKILLGVKLVAILLKFFNFSANRAIIRVVCPKFGFL